CELTADRADVCLAGNHDLAVRGDIPLNEFSRGAELAARWTQETLADENLAYLYELEPKEVHDGLGLYHASPRDPVWEYVLSTLLAELCLDAQAERVCLIGHSHVALAFMREEGRPATGGACPAGTTRALSEAERLVNPGSAGQPRDRGEVAGRGQAQCTQTETTRSTQSTATAPSAQTGESTATTATETTTTTPPTTPAPPPSTGTTDTGQSGGVGPGTGGSGAQRS